MIKDIEKIDFAFQPNISLKVFDQEIGEIKKISKKVAFPLLVLLRRVDEF